MERVIVKDKYNMITTLDRKLKSLEELADKKGYDIDENVLYIKCCSILTKAQFSGRKKIVSTMWWQYYNIVQYEVEKFVQNVN